MLISFVRVLKFAVRDLKRNLWLSVVTTMVLVLTLLSVNGLLAMNFLMRSAAKVLENKVDVSLYLKPEISGERAREVRGVLNKISGVLSVKLVEPDEALAQFEEKYSSDQTVLEALRVIEKNPFGPTLVVKAANPEVYRSVLDTIAKQNYEGLITDQTFDYHSVLIEKIGRLTRKINQAGILISGVFGLIALLIAMTTVRVAIYTHRETIGIMKLVGASNWFVRLPYLIGGVILSIVAVGVTLGIAYPSLGLIEGYLGNLFSGETLELAKYFKDNFWIILGSELGLTAFFNLAVTSFAVGRYLKV